jgi:hypothetical protein
MGFMSFGLLVGRLGAFLEQQAPAEREETVPEEEGAFPAPVLRIREELSHHIIPLLMLARCDGEAGDLERAAIVAHCRARLKEEGTVLTSRDERAFGAYLRSYRPTRLQLGLAMKRLTQEPQKEIAALVAAARAVVDADRERRPREAQFLAELADDLDTL